MSFGLNGVKGNEGDLAKLVKHRLDLLIGHRAVGAEQPVEGGTGQSEGLGDLADGEREPVHGFLRCPAPLRWGSCSDTKATGALVTRVVKPPVWRHRDRRARVGKSLVSEAANPEMVAVDLHGLSGKT